MEKRWTFKKIAPLILSIVLLFTLLQATGLSVYAQEEGPKVFLGASGINNPSNISYSSWSGDYVYYGGDLYRVLSIDGSTMLLDCDTVVEYKQFDNNPADGLSNDWNRSAIKSWLNGEFMNRFNPAEKATIVSTTKVAGDTVNDYLPGVALNEEKIFLLEAAEAQNSDYGYVYPEARIKSGSMWWLRSPNSGITNSAGVVSEYGGIVHADVYDPRVGVSPAFNINLSSVLFSSLIPQNSNQYQLTLMDGNLSISIPDGANAVRNGTEITVPYIISEGAQAYVMVIDSTNAVKQYTKLTAGSETGTGTFTLDSSIIGTWGENYKVYILAVNEGGKGYSDAASDLYEVKAPQLTSVDASAENVIAVYDRKPHGITVSVTVPASGATVEFGTEAGTYGLTESPAITDVADSPLTVYYQVTAANYDAYEGSATVTIEPKSIEGATVTLDKTSLKYTGSGQSVSVTGVFLSDGTELPAIDYDVSGTTYGRDFGSYKVTVTGKGNYKGTADVSWTIGEEPTEEPKEPETPTEPSTEKPTENPTEEPTEAPTEPETPTEQPTNPGEPTEPETPTEPPTNPEEQPDYYPHFSIEWVTRQGWAKDYNGWHYYDQNGTKLKNQWLADNGNWYYLDSKGNMATGWLLDNGKYYFLDETSGAMKTGWLYKDGSWYFLDYKTGARHTGWLWDDYNYNWYYLDDPSGIMQTGWVYDSGSWYYMYLSGAMATGWVYVDDAWHYFWSDGSMATGNVIIGDTWYSFDENGIWIE